MLGFRDVVSGLKQLGLDPAKPVIVHASLSAFGEIRGGADTLLGALLSVQPVVMMPAFTYKTMLVPEEGPEDNAFSYGHGKDQNLMAEFYRPDMPADRTMGILAETLRKQPQARRSLHPILSFTGMQVDIELDAQTMTDPLAPVGVMAGREGWVLLMGVNHTVNTSLHYAEKIAGRKQFLRWALTTGGVRECPGFSGCSDGFEKAGAWLEDLTRFTRIGGADIQALPLRAMIDRIVQLIGQNPDALLCDRVDCERCATIRQQNQSTLTSGPAGGNHVG
jgi:aminoglycoside 3-N-acetyltransferase